VALRAERQAQLVTVEFARVEEGERLPLDVHAHFKGDSVALNRSVRDFQLPGGLRQPAGEPAPVALEFQNNAARCARSSRRPLAVHAGRCRAK
jgi:hypothetical protein